ncbi:heat-shock transcription factor-1 [Coelomomyces lativittatus]|nr:heat-shock transcription factor-1 [Coelomomyces lativittatus]KAJ1503933.1 heat-shock transcription factor-1 [Coelomomyces lativittatus]
MDKSPSFQISTHYSHTASSMLSPPTTSYSHSEKMYVTPNYNSNPMSMKRLSSPPKVTSFILKLYQMLEDKQRQDVIFWLPSGTEFAFKPKHEQLPSILFHYFKHGNESSLIRQLNMYGFLKKKKTSTNDSLVDEPCCIYKHPQFIQGKPELLIFISRHDKPTTTPRHGIENNISKDHLKSESILQILSHLESKIQTQETLLHSILRRLP